MAQIPKSLLPTRMPGERAQAWEETTAVDTEFELTCTNGFRVKVNPATNKTTVFDAVGNPVFFIKRLTLTIDGISPPKLELQRMGCRNAS